MFLKIHMVNALGNNSSCLEMDIVKSEEGLTFQNMVQTPFLLD